ncbi:MAG: NYN domain-containing protein [Pyrinomonadaceae bacterium]
MSYLVDGNNLMGQRIGERRVLMDELAAYAQAKKISLDVVFDGAPEDHFGDGAGYRGIRVYYAARNSNADERIKRMVEASRERRTLLVVTSDRALADYVRRCGARVVPVKQFRRDMETAVQQAPSGVEYQGCQKA